jgi:hypothetical protein
LNLDAFPLVLRLETINNIGDAIALWSNRFKTSDGQLLWHLSNIGYIGNSNSIIGKLSYQNTYARITVILR